MHSKLTALNENELAPYMPIQYNGALLILYAVAMFGGMAVMMDQDSTFWAKLVCGFMAVAGIIIAVMHMNKTAPDCKANPLQWLYLFWKRNVMGYWLIAEFNGKGGLTYHVADSLHAYPHKTRTILVSLKDKKRVVFDGGEQVATYSFNAVWALRCMGILAAEGIVLLRLIDKYGDALTLQVGEFFSLFVYDPASRECTLPYHSLPELYRSQVQQEQEQQAS